MATTRRTISEDDAYQAIVSRADVHVACDRVEVGAGSAASAPHVDMRVPPGQVAHELTDSGCPRVLSEMLSIIAASSRNTRTRSNQLPGSIAKPRVPLISWRVQVFRTYACETPTMQYRAFFR
jgi:hypothetical protein